MRTPRCDQSFRQQPSNKPAPGSAVLQFVQLVLALNRIAASLDRVAEAVAPALDRRYKSNSDSNRNLISESAMAALMHIKPRTLATYRRKGKLPECWVRNGRRALWHADQTLAAWTRGIT